jgi:hypothetical protein
LILSSAFHPQTDGQSEVVNRMIAMYLRCLTGDHPHSWLKWLPWAEFCYNSSYQTTLHTTPFQVVYGRPPPSLIKYQGGTSQVQAVYEHLKEHDEFLQQIREQLLLAQDVMKNQHNKKHRLVEFNLGDWIWLRLQHRSATRITQLQPNKLSPRFYGPYQVVERIGEVAYRLQLPPKAKIHDVFHVALLKKFEGQTPSAVTPLPTIQNGRVIPTSEKVIRARLNRGNWEVLVAWQGQPLTSATWEKVANFKLAYPEVQLEDDLFLGEEGNVVDSFVEKVYQRRCPTRQVTEGNMS